MNDSDPAVKTSIVTDRETPSIGAVVRDWPMAVRIVWGGALATVAVFAYGLSRFWLDSYESADRLLILAGAGWAWFRMRGELSLIPSRPLFLLGIIPLIAGFASLTPTWFAYSQIGPRPVLMWMLFGTAIATVAGMTAIQFGWRTLTAIRFPLFVLILALPIPGRINVPIQAFLQSATTVVAHQSLLATGFEVVREGYVLRLPHGRARGNAGACRRRIAADGADAEHPDQTARAAVRAATLFANDAETAAHRRRSDRVAVR